jgi:hypothetical protein
VVPTAEAGSSIYNRRAASEERRREERRVASRDARTGAGRQAGRQAERFESHAHSSRQHVCPLQYTCSGSGVDDLAGCVCGSNLPLPQCAKQTS